MLIETEHAATAKQHPRLAYKLKEAADILGLSEKSIRRAITRGLIKPSRAFRHVLIPASELEAFLRNTTLDLESGADEGRTS